MLSLPPDPPRGYSRWPVLDHALAQRGDDIRTHRQLLFRDEVLDTSIFERRAPRPLLANIASDYRTRGRATRAAGYRAAILWCLGMFVGSLLRIWSASSKPATSWP